MGSKVRKFKGGLHSALLGLAVVLVCGPAWAQGDDPGCALRVMGQDTGCAGVVGCADRTGCTFYDFHVVCGGPFTLTAWVTGDASCGHCAACVTIYPSLGGGAVAWCYTDDDPWCSQHQGVCVKRCDGISLSPGYYRMQVCLVACTEGDFNTCCVHGEYNFAAHGCVTSPGYTCP